jgi:hypothetical protein
MKYTLRTAAEACGISKTAIHNAIKSGKLSAQKNIEQQKGHDVTDKDSIENAYLRRENELLREQVAREKEQADHWRRQATMLLEHQPETPKAEPDSPVKSRLFEKLFGKRNY